MIAESELRTHIEAAVVRFTVLPSNFPEIEDMQRWDRSFAASHDILKKLADEALADHRAGRTRPIEPDSM